MKLYYRTTDPKTGKQRWNPVPGMSISFDGDCIDILTEVWILQERMTTSLGVLYTKASLNE